MNELINITCEEFLISQKDQFINLTVTSPPYNVDLGNDRLKVTEKYDVYNDNLEYDDWLLKLEFVFRNIYRVTVSGGRCCINIGDQKNGRVSVTTDIINMMNSVGWLNYTRIVWNKKQVNPRTAWGSFNSPKQPSFPTPFEYILVFAKDSLNLNRVGESDLIKEEFIRYSLAMWEFPPVRKKDTMHPAAFPTELPYRCIKMFSYVDDVVYDPYAGIGTTLRVANRLGRRFVGNEISKKYCDIFYKNIKRENEEI